MESKLGEQYARCIVFTRRGSFGVWRLRRQRAHRHKSSPDERGLQDKHATVKAFFKPNISAVTASSNANNGLNTVQLLRC